MKRLKTLFLKSKQENFWDLINLLDWENEGNDNKVIEPIVAHLASLSVKNIKDFQETLAQKLYALDGLEWAKESGSILWRNNELVSVDGFLYERCVVVANGQEFYEQVLNDPVSMPKNTEFEVLLYAAPEALKRKTSDERRY